MQSVEVRMAKRPRPDFFGARGPSLVQEMPDAVEADAERAQEKLHEAAREKECPRNAPSAGAGARAVRRPRAVSR